MKFRDLQRQYWELKAEIDKAISDVLLQSNFISGYQVTELEEKLADYVDVKHCITCANGTDALMLALKAMGIGEGDVVFVPDFTFFASGEAPASLGATVAFVDVDERTYNISPNNLIEAIEIVLKEGKLTPKAVIAVDLFGLPADYRKLTDICKKYGLYLLEDGAQGFGGSIGNKRSCGFGDISTTSFFPAKPLGCYGDGGAIFTNNDEWADLIRSFAVHGKDADDKYNNIRIGQNSRLDTIQAAILEVKLEAFKRYELDKINLVAQEYSSKLSETDVCLPEIDDGFCSSWAQYTVQFKDIAQRDWIKEKLKDEGIPTMIYYPKPMHEQMAFVGKQYGSTKCSMTRKLSERVLSLPIGPYINEEEITRVTDTIKRLTN